MTDTARAPIPMFEQRRIEAAILKHVYDTLKASHGPEVAQKTIADSVRASSIEQAKEFAAKVGGRHPSRPSSIASRSGSAAAPWRWRSRSRPKRVTCLT
jgi:hypothetical protein